MVRGGDSYYGLLQAFADALKLLVKEYVAPTQSNIILFFLGPVITLVFSLLGYAVIPYGPSLYISDFNLGIFYMLAVSSIATYGILLAGLKVSPPILWIFGNKLSEFQEILKVSKFEAKHILFKYVCSTTKKIIYINNYFLMSAQEFNFYLYFLFNFVFYKTKVLFFLAWLCFLYYFIIEVYNHDTVIMYLFILKPPKGLIQPFSTSIIKNNELKLEELKASHLLFIKELYKNREAPVIPFDYNLILATCSHCLDSKVKTEFLKQWGSKCCKSQA